MAAFTPLTSLDAQVLPLAEPWPVLLPQLPHHGPVWRNLAPATLVEKCLARGEGFLATNGALVVYTGARTGRSPKDRFILRDPATEMLVDWNTINQAADRTLFERLLQRVQAYAQGRELFLFDGFAGADPRYRLAVRVIAEKCWHGLFAHTLFRRPTVEELTNFRPDVTILNMSGLKAVPEQDGTRSDACGLLDFAQRQVLFVGTQYAGETKKAVFTYLNYLLPQHGVLPMHCAANVSPQGEVALFFGLSGTGKTTLSADPHRRLIGDDEHGWSDEGIFNFEGGCYAKTIRLSRDGEPQIWDAIRFGSVLENVVVDPVTRHPDYDSDRITENTRATYPVEFIDNCDLTGQAGHPHHIFFLTCDAFGVLPPISKLTHEQAVSHFLLGYTAKIAGTETGVTKPEATFSTCFGAPFMPLPPQRYAELLRQRLQEHQPQVWLVNTGWSSGPAGTTPRIKLRFTRAMLTSALDGTLAQVPLEPDPVFGLPVPLHCPNVPSELLQPRQTWSNAHDYDVAARRLAALFAENLRKYGREQ